MRVVSARDKDRPGCTRAVSPLLRLRDDAQVRQIFRLVEVARLLVGDHAHHMSTRDRAGFSARRIASSALRHGTGLPGARLPRFPATYG